MGFITGKSPHEAEIMVNTGQYGHHATLDIARHPTLSGVLKDQGYTTAYFGKSHFAADLVDMAPPTRTSPAWKWRSTTP